MSASVTAIGVLSLKDVSANLRRLADDMDSGKHPHASSAVLVMGYPDGDIWVNGFGERVSPLEVCGWLSRGLTKVASLTDPARSAAPDPAP